MSRSIVSRSRVAQHVGVSQRTVENWIGAGHIKGYKVAGGQIAVDLAEVEAFLAANPRHDGRKRFGPKAQIIDASNVVLGES